VALTGCTDHKRITPETRLLFSLEPIIPKSPSFFLVLNLFLYHPQCFLGIMFVPYRMYIFSFSMSDRKTGVALRLSASGLDVDQGFLSIPHYYINNPAQIYQPTHGRLRLQSDIK